MTYVLCIKYYLLLLLFAEDYRLTDCKTSSRSDSGSDDDDDVGTSDKQSDLTSENQDMKGNEFNFIDLSYYKR